MNTLRERLEAAMNEARATNRSKAELAVQHLVPAVLEKFEIAMMNAAKLGKEFINVAIDEFADIPMDDPNQPGMTSEAYQQQYQDRRRELIRLVVVAVKTKHPGLEVSGSDSLHAAWLRPHPMI
jgi:hypothetical protein